VSDIQGPNDILHLELSGEDVVAQLVDNACKLSRGQPRIVLALGSRDNYLAARKNETCGFWLANAHDDGRETFGIVFAVPSFEDDILQVQPHTEVDSSDDGSDDGLMVAA
jgi:hypothetical protein